MADTEHKHGEMDTTAQEKTFEGFIRMSMWVTIAVLVILLSLYLING